MAIRNEPLLRILQYPYKIPLLWYKNSPKDLMKGKRTVRIQRSPVLKSLASIYLIKASIVSLLNKILTTDKRDSFDIEGM